MKTINKTLVGQAEKLSNEWGNSAFIVMNPDGNLAATVWNNWQHEEPRRPIVASVDGTQGWQLHSEFASLVQFEEEPEGLQIHARETSQRAFLEGVLALCNNQISFPTGVNFKILRAQVEAALKSRIILRMDYAFDFEVRTSLKEYEAFQVAIRRLGFQEREIKDVPNEKAVEFLIPVKGVREAELLQQVYYRIKKH